MGLKDWDVTDVVQILNGVPLGAGAAGYSSDDFVKVTYDGDLFEDVQGCDGEVTRYRTHNNRATVTISIMSTSGMNDRLSGILLLDSNTPNGAGAGAYLLKDKEGRMLFSAERAWVKGWPSDISLGKAPGTVVWTIRMASPVFYVGGR